MDLAKVQFSVTHLGFTGRTRRVGVLGEFLSLMVLQTQALCHFATLITLITFRPNLGISAAVTLIGPLCAHKGFLVDWTAIQVAIAFCLRTGWTLEVGMGRNGKPWWFFL